MAPRTVAVVKSLGRSSIVLKFRAPSVQKPSGIQIYYLVGVNFRTPPPLHPGKLSCRPNVTSKFSVCGANTRKCKLLLDQYHLGFRTPLARKPPCKPSQHLKNFPPAAPKYPENYTTFVTLTNRNLITSTGGTRRT